MRDTGDLSVSLVAHCDETGVGFLHVLGDAWCMAFAKEEVSRALNWRRVNSEVRDATTTLSLGQATEWSKGGITERGSANVKGRVEVRVVCLRIILVSE